MKKIIFDLQNFFSKNIIYQSAFFWNIVIYNVVSISSVQLSVPIYF